MQLAQKELHAALREVGMQAFSSTALVDLIYLCPCST